MIGTLNRNVTTEECEWLDNDLPKGRLVFEYNGPTYGCISSDGIAVTEIENETPFFEVPNDSVTWHEDII